MKKSVLLCLALSLAMLSCSKDEEITGSAVGTTPPGKRARVVEYSPAPGQFINESGDLVSGQRAAEWAQQTVDNGGYVSLGAFGGYLTIRFEGGVPDKAGYDFFIKGNPTETSSEPGIVWVSADANGNGLPDDKWYELPGPATAVRGYSVTYRRRDTPGDVAWTDSEGGGGVVKHLPLYHEQNYFPSWISSEEYTLTGTRLEANTLYEDGTWKNMPCEWGYADNDGSDLYTGKGPAYRANCFDMARGVDAAGRPAGLAAIDFVRVQSAILHNVEQIGEVSTEVCGFGWY